MVCSLFPVRSKKVHNQIHLPQLCQPVMQSRLHRSQRAAEGRCNLVQRGAREESQLDHQAMLFGQIRHGSANRSGVF